MLKVYNTLSRKKEIFKSKKKINLFVCGPTVYDFSHIGHARTYIAFDVIAKYLKYKKYNVFYLQNITDIDDKIIKRAKEKKITAQKLARTFEKEYLKDMKTLKINSVTKYARATDHIKEIISQIERLLKKGYAYKIEDGIYYNIKKFKQYGKLSRRTMFEAEDAISRIDENRGKKNKGDFCLWKFSKPGEPKWPSSFGIGRPGWHIEDTAITEKYLGPRYDIHGGGRDLITPHHEAEIALMETISGKKPLAKYWLHTDFITIKEEKMAKSLDNFITIKEFLKTYSPRILRLLVIKNHYRSPVEYNKKVAVQIKNELDRIDEFVEKLQTIKDRDKDLKPANNLIPEARNKFEEAMDDDFNTPRALAVLFNLITKVNSLLAKGQISKKEAGEILNFLKEIDNTFNFILWEKPKKKIPVGILELIRQREKSRKEKDWQKADTLRKKIQQMGYWVEDTNEGSKIKKI